MKYKKIIDVINEKFKILLYLHRIRVFGCKKGKPLAVLDYHSGTIQSIAFTGSSLAHRSNLMISGSKDGRVSLWKLY